MKEEVKYIRSPFTWDEDLHVLSTDQCLLLLDPLNISGESYKKIRDLSTLIRTSRSVGVIFGILSWNNLKISKAIIRMLGNMIKDSGYLDIRKKFE